MSDAPRGESRELAGDARIISWQPPVLILERAGEIRRIFLAAGARAAWFGIDGKAWLLPSAGGGTGSAAVEHDAGDLTAPMPGRVIEVLVAPGASVAAGERLLVLEAMKMETPLRAPCAGIVRALHVSAGSTVEPGQVLVEIDAREDG